MYKASKILNSTKPPKNLMQFQKIDVDKLFLKFIFIIYIHLYFIIKIIINAFFEKKNYPIQWYRSQTHFLKSLCLYIIKYKKIFLSFNSLEFISLRFLQKVIKNCIYAHFEVWIARKIIEKGKAPVLVTLNLIKHSKVFVRANFSTCL